MGLALTIPEDEAPQSQGIPLSLPETPANPISDEAAERRASMAASVPPGWQKDDAWKQISNGNEGVLRDQASSTILGERAKKYQDVIMKMSRENEGQLTTEQMYGVIDNLRYEEQVYNPKSVFEAGTTQAYYAHLDKTSAETRGSWWSNYTKLAPAEAREATAMSKSFNTGMLDIKRRAENAAAAAQEESWPDYLGNREKDLISLGTRSVVAPRLSVPGMVGGPGLFVREYYEQARQAIINLPPVERSKVLDEIEKNLDYYQDPSMKKRFFESLLGQSDRMADDAWDAITLLTLPGIGLALKGFREAGRAVTKSIFKSAASKGEPKVAIPAAVGDLEQAATERVISDKTKLVTGTADPAAVAVDDMLHTYRATGRKIVDSAPDNYRELSVRIGLEWDRDVDRLNALLGSSSKIDRLNPETIKAITPALKEKIIDTYKGADNQVLEVGDPILHPKANVYLQEVKIGKSKGTYYAEKSSAEAEARGHNWAIEGDNVLGERQRLERVIGDIDAELSAQSIMPGTVKGTLTGTISPQTKTGKVLVTAETKPPAKWGKLPQAVETEQGLSLDQATIKGLEDQRTKALGELNDLRMSPGVAIKNDGLGWYISKWEAVNETDNIVLKNLIGHSPDASIPTSITSSFLGKLRGKVSKDTVTNAKVASFAGNLYYELAESVSAKLNEAARLAVIPGTTKKTRWDALEDMLNAIASGATRHPVTGQKGYKFETIPQINEFYLNHQGRTAAPIEIEAYFSWRRLEEFAKGMKNLRRYTDDARRGVKEYRHNVIGEDGKPEKGPWFEAIKKPDTPPPGEDSILVTTEKGAASQSRFGPKDNKRMKDAKDKGEAEYLELVRPGEKPFAGWRGITSEDRPRYTFHNSFEERPLTFKNREDERPFEYDYNYSVSLPKMEKDPGSGFWHYVGDNAALRTNSLKAATKFADMFNQIKTLIVKGKHDEAQQLADRLKLPMDWAEHVGMYESGRFNPSVHPWGWDKPVELDYRVVPHGKNINSLDNSLSNKFVDPENGRVLFRDSTPSIGYEGLKDFYEVYTPQKSGSLFNPAYSFVPAQTMKPLAAANRSFQRIINSAYMEDFKISAVTHWLEEAKLLLKIKDPERIHEAPYSIFFNTELKGMDTKRGQELENARQRIKNLLGLPTEMEKWLHATAETLAEQPGGILPSKLLHSTTDVSKFMRTIVYNVTLGPFSPAQIFVQNANYVSIFGLAGGKFAVPGTAAGFLHQLGRINENMIPALDKLAVFLTAGGDAEFKHGEFTRLREMMGETGFHKMVAEHMMYDNPYSARLIKNAAVKVIDTGSMFLRGSERNQRFAAWYTAGKEWMLNNPDKSIFNINNYDRNQIFQRAEVLSGDMTRVSKTSLEKGPLSFSTQFLTYNLRTLDRMLEKDTTMLERARMVMAYSLMGGVTSVAGFGAMGDLYKRIAINQFNYSPDEHKIMTWINEGAVAPALKMITGHWYNVPERYFSIGLDQIRDLLDGDATWWKFVQGSLGSFISTTFENAKPATKALIHIMDDKVPLTSRDVIEAFSSIKFVSDAARLYSAVTTGNWLSKKGEILATDVSAWNAIWMTATGLSPYNIAQLRNIHAISADREKELNDVDKEFLRMYSHMEQAFAQNDLSNAQAYQKKMAALLVPVDYPNERLHLLMSKANSSNRSAVESTLKSLIRDVAQSKKQSKINLIREFREIK